MQRSVSGLNPHAVVFVPTTSAMDITSSKDAPKLGDATSHKSTTCCANQ